MATAQKRGFHLPWGNEPRSDESPQDDRDGRASSDDLGDGPFGLTGPAAEAPEASEASEASEATIDVEAVDAARLAKVLESAPEPSSRGSQAASERGRTTDRGPAASLIDDEPIRGRVSWPQSDRATVGPLSQPVRRTAEPLPEPVTKAAEPVAKAAEPVAKAAEPVTKAAEPVAKAAEPLAKAAEPVTRPDPAAAPRRDNPLVAGLVRAMREAARTARKEAVANLHGEAEARGEAIRTQSAETATELRTNADTDIAAIKDWSRTELARVREETEARIAARKTQLVEEIEFEAQSAEARIESLRATIESFEAEMEAFFEALLAEEDPARLAGLAERMPTVPALDGYPMPERAEEEAPRGRRGAATRAAPGQQTLDPTTADASPETDPVDAPEAAGEPAAPGETARLDHLDPDAAAAAEAEALAGLDVQTHLVVTGLSSVAGIAGFKAALLHVGGVSAVNVNAGEAGDVQFTVTHDRQTDLRDALRSLEAFDPTVTADDGATLTIEAQEPADD